MSEFRGVERSRLHFRPAPRAVLLYVHRAHDCSNRTRRHCALKVVKSAGRYAETARDEIKLLRQVMDANPSHRGRNHVVSFLDSFDHPGPEDSHICLVFEPLGENLLALIERHKKTGVAVDLVKVIAKQMLLGLQYLHDECDLVHTDIKPENIRECFRLWFWCHLLTTEHYPVISIPDVEAHIQSELSRSPSPTSRKVIIPPKQATRASVSIPHHHKSGRERQVQIFDSQPLASPSSHSCPNSPARLSYISRVASAQSALASFASTSSSNAVNSVRRKSAGKLALATGHYEPSASTSDGSSDDSSASGSGSSSSASRYGSVMVSSSVATSLSNDTPPTSVASVASGIGKMAFTDSPEAEKASSPCTCTCGIQGVAESTEEQDSKPSQQPPRPAAGPSLLSQTAPADLKPLPSATTCSQHPHLPSSSSPHPHTSSQSDALPDESAPLPPPLPISIKIADLGNATPTRKHYTEDIQTRQYRAPEAIVGRTDWGATADIWSVACVLFELLTAEYLFDPQSQGDLFGKDDDHVAQIIELLGDYGETKWGGRFSRELFDSSGTWRSLLSVLCGVYICFDVGAATHTFLGWLSALASPGTCAPRLALCFQNEDAGALCCCADVGG